MTEESDLTNKRSWTDDQLEKAGVPEIPQEVIKGLLETLWNYEVRNKLDGATSSKIVSTFAELAKGHVLVPAEPEAVWVQARPGVLVVRDRVRVKVDAYPGTKGMEHNGREGDIVAIRYGDIHVRYTDREESAPEFVRHLPQALEKRIR